MTKKEIIQFWINSSDENYRSMLNMFNSGEYVWALFIGHLVLEKLLKGYYVKKIEKDSPRTHDLYKLAVKSNLDLTGEQRDSLQYITLFNIESRYEEYKTEFYKKCTKKLAEENIKKIKALRTWLKKMIKE